MKPSFGKLKKSVRISFTRLSFIRQMMYANDRTNISKKPFQKNLGYHSLLWEPVDLGCTVTSLVGMACLN